MRNTKCQYVISSLSFSKTLLNFESIPLPAYSKSRDGKWIFE